LLHKESGWEAVREVLGGASLSTVNWSEVLQKAKAHGVDTAGMREEMEATGVQLVPFTAEDAEVAADLWDAGKALGLSLGDRACLALARRLGLQAVTTDRTWKRLIAGVMVCVVR
jgi:PIN domain nuclease of toxin-antitoxin system